jgi:sulfate adenylyltransferase subunit 1
MGLLTVSAPAQEAFSGFAKEGGRVGSGTLGSGTGGVARCAR